MLYSYSGKIKPKKNLKKELKEQKLTYSQVSKLVSVEKSDISKIILGKKRYNETNLVGFAELLKCSTDYLLDRTNEKLVFKGYSKNEIENIVFGKYANTIAKREAIEIISQLDEKQVQIILNILRKYKED